MGLAVGDALGSAVEFKAPGTFPPVTGMRGGGPWNLEPGQWTDDMSMALCLAESLIESPGYHPADQMERYVRWYREGHLSSTGICFDIGTTTAAALNRFTRTGDPYSGSTDPYSAGNGSIMRLAPVPIFYAARGRYEEAVGMAGDSSRTTHGAPACVDGCRYFGALITGALIGAEKEELLSPLYCPPLEMGDGPGAAEDKGRDRRSTYWDAHPMVPEIQAVAEGSFKHRNPPEIRGSGYVVESLEAALWAFYHSDTFEEGSLLAVNLGDDADTTGAVYGQLAGAYYGFEAIPRQWREAVTMKELIVEYADILSEAGTPA